MRLLFHQDLIQEGENPYSQGWYDVSNEISNVTLSLYALEECVTYAGAYVESEFDKETDVPTGNMMSCIDTEILTASQRMANHLISLTFAIQISR